MDQQSIQSLDGAPSLARAWNVIELSSTAELRRHADSWDDLWARSPTATPGARAELIALWTDCYQPGGTFRALAVTCNGRWMGAIALVDRRMRGIVNVGALPAGCWGSGSPLLLDTTDAAMAIEAADRLVAGLKRLPWPLVWLNDIRYEDPEWKALRAALERGDVPHRVRNTWQVGQVERAGDAQAFEKRLDGDFRRNQNRCTRLLEAAGGYSVRVEDALSPDEVGTWLRRGFEVEDRSWKGAEGVSLLKREPIVLEHCLAEARQLVQWGQLSLVFLEHRGQPIAFIYGWSAKGTFFLSKIGYDDAFARFTPGQQLVRRTLERLHHLPSIRILDFAGPLVDWHRPWRPAVLPVGVMVVATSGRWSRLLLQAEADWQPRLKQLGQRAIARLKAGN
jgi:CelD/BcsL family acetyltransferase involved in cellulose biosynthesis